jgi:hypothetical protein
VARRPLTEGISILEKNRNSLSRAAGLNGEARASRGPRSALPFTLRGTGRNCWWVGRAGSGPSWPRRRGQGSAGPGGWAPPVETVAGMGMAQPVGRDLGREGSPLGGGFDHPIHFFGYLLCVAGNSHTSVICLSDSPKPLLSGGPTCDPLRSYHAHSLDHLAVCGGPGAGGG